MQTQKEPQQQPQKINSSGSIDYNSSLVSMEEKDDQDMCRSTLLAFRAKEEEIERKKMEVREKVQTNLGRVAEESKRLAEIREELEALADPMRKDVALVRKKIDLVNKDLKPLGQSCQKKEKEYREALEALNEKNREKAQLVARLKEIEELVGESERVRMQKLEELCKNMDSLK